MKNLDSNTNKSKSLATYTVKHKFPLTFIVFLYLCLCVIIFHFLNNTLIIATEKHPITIQMVVDPEKDYANEPIPNNSE